MKKILSILVSMVVIICSFSPVYGFDAVKKAKTNTDFALKCADVVNGAKVNTPNSTSGANRIIGRASDKDFSFSGLGVSDGVMGADGRFLLCFDSPSAMKKCLDYLNSNGNIIYAHEDAVVFTNGSETERTPVSWGVSAIGADIYSRYVSENTQGRVTVAIVDSGIERIDFLSDRLVDGIDLVSESGNGATDESVDSHGTFLASIVADCTAESNVDIMPVRVLKSKQGSLSTAVNGIYYAVDNDAEVVNVSLGGVLNNCAALDNALAYAESKNVSVVVCAGNNKSDITNYCPAHNESAITVTAVDENLAFSHAYSNYGNAVDMCAPGNNVAGYGADGELKTMSGTSMSAAFISAGTALYRLHRPLLSSAQVQQSIKEVCTDLGDEGHDVYYGFGIPDFEKLIIDDEVQPEPVKITGISIAKTPDKTVYTYKTDEQINLEGLVLNVEYSDSTTETLADISGVSVSEYSFEKEGIQKITLTYEGFEAEFEIKVEYVWWQWIIRILLLGFLWY